MGNVTLLDSNGNEKAVPEDLVPAAIAQGFSRPTDAQHTEAVVEDYNQKTFGGAAGKAQAVADGLLRGATLGASDAFYAAAAPGDNSVAQVKERNPLLATGSELAGAVIDPLGAVGGIAGGAGRAVEGALGEGAGLLGQVGARVAGGAAEGGVLGAGQGLGELARSDDPLTAEHIASALSSNILYGGAIGGVAGGAGKLFEKGLVRAKGALDSARADAALLGNTPEDLAKLDAKGLREARGTELDAIEAGRVPQRSTLADDIRAYRGDLKDQKLWLATKGGAVDAAGEDIPGIKAIGKRTLQADRQLDRLIDNPYALAEKPEAAIAALQKQQAALEELQANAPKLREGFDASAARTRQELLDEQLEAAGPRPPGAKPLPELEPAAATTKPNARAEALDNVPAALERNKALQARIRELQAEPSSPRLKAIEDARDALATRSSDKSLAETMLGGSVQGAITHAAGAVLPGVGHALGAVAGAKASKMLTSLVFDRAAAVSAEQLARSARAVDAVLEVGGKVSTKARAASIPLATRELAKVSFAPAPHPSLGERMPPHAPLDPEASRSAPSLAQLFKARSAELRSQVEVAPDGSLQMREAARDAMAARLAPLRAAHPLLADQVETIAARRLTYLTSILPRRPDIGGIPTGPDRWQPSDLAMREFARKVAAVEDPGAVEERVAHGTVTPSDVEAYRAVYPERAAAFTRAVIERLPTLRKTLPYSRQIALSIFTGVPVAAAMTPGIVSVLQAQFDNEPGTEGGMQAPRPMPQFGSVKKSIPAPTPGQTRSQG